MKKKRNSEQNCLKIVDSVNVMWRLFCQVIKVSPEIDATNAVELFLEEKDKIHKNLSEIVGD